MLYILCKTPSWTKAKFAFKYMAQNCNESMGKHLFQFTIFVTFFFLLFTTIW